jgi:hypothetical protein
MYPDWNDLWWIGIHPGYWTFKIGPNELMDYLLLKWFNI